MDHQPAQRLSDLLSRIDRQVAEPAMRPLRRLLDRPGAGDSLIVALVGPSGVGKSRLMNRIAGERIVSSGPLRPTTTSISVWGDVSSDYLAGARVEGPAPPDRIVLVDTPAAEHYPETILDVLDLVDAAIVVTSADRYADAVTAETLATVTDRGLPVHLVLSVDTGEAVDEHVIAVDAEGKLGHAVDAVVGEDLEPFAVLLSDLGARRDEIMRLRQERSAAFVAGRARDVADHFADVTEDAAVLAVRAREILSDTRIDRERLAEAAAGEWDGAASEIVTLCEEAVDERIDVLVAEHSTDANAAASIASAATSLPAVDRRPIDAWHRTITDAALRMLRRRWLHPLRKRAVRDDLWKLSIDFEKKPSKRVRAAVGDRLPDVRIEFGAAFDAAVADACHDRIESFTTRLDPYASVEPEDIRAAADAVAVAAVDPGSEEGSDE